MNLSVSDPISVRALFRRRRFEGFVLLAGIFLGCVGVSSLFAYFLSFYFFQTAIVMMVAGDVLAGLLAYYIFAWFDRQPMQVRCESCLGSVECKTPWVCGHCDHENWNVGKFPFISHCEKCRVPPKSYICHHCENENRGEQHIFFSADRDKSNPARRIRQQGFEAKRRAQTEFDTARAFEAKKRDLREEYDQKKQTVESAQLDLVMEQIKAKIKLAKKGGTVPVETEANIYYEAWKKFKSSSDALDEAYDMIDRELAKMHSGDETSLKKQRLKLKEWKTRELAKLTKNPPQK